MGPTTFLPAILLLLLQGLILIHGQDAQPSDQNILEGSSPDEIKQSFEKLIAEKFNISAEADPSSAGESPSADQPDENSPPITPQPPICGSSEQIPTPQPPAAPEADAQQGAPEAEASSSPVSEEPRSEGSYGQFYQESLPCTAYRGAPVSNPPSQPQDNLPQPAPEAAEATGGSEASPSIPEAGSESPSLNVCPVQDDSHPEPFPSCSSDYQLASQEPLPSNSPAETCAQNQEPEPQLEPASNPSEVKATQGFQSWSSENLAESSKIIGESEEAHYRCPRSNVCSPPIISSPIPIASKCSIGRSYSYPLCSNTPQGQISYSSQIGSCSPQYPPQCIQHTASHSIAHCGSPSISNSIPPVISRVSPQSTPECITHRIEKVVKPVVDECLTTVPVVKKTLRNHVVETKRYVSVPQRIVLAQHEKYIRHVPVAHKSTRTVVDYVTRHVPVIRERNRTIEETYTEHVPVTENVTRTVIETIVKKVPVVVSRLRPVVHQKIRHVPVVETRLRPVIQETVTVVPVRQRIVKNLVECRIKQTRTPYIPFAVPAVPVLLKNNPAIYPTPSRPYITPCSTPCHIK